MPFAWAASSASAICVAELDHFGGRQRFAGHVRGKRFAFEQLHHQKRLVVILADVEDRADIRMIERGRGARFALEPFEGFAIRGERGRQEFDGDLPAQARVFGAIDHAHAALAQVRNNAIVGNRSPEHF